jgi:hypothetical protein
MLNRLSRWRERRRPFKPGETLPGSTVAVNVTGQPEKVTYISGPVSWSLRDLHREKERIDRYRRYTRGES